MFIVSRVKRDWDKTRTVAGYIKRRLCEKSTIAAGAASFGTATNLREPYAALSVIAAIVIVILPSSALTPIPADEAPAAGDGN